LQFLENIKRVEEEDEKFRMEGFKTFLLTRNFPKVSISTI